MSHYSENAASVRVDFFKASGKWYCTEAVIWTGVWGDASIMHDEFAVSLVAHLRDPDSGNMRLSEMTAVCLEPYHQHSHPIHMTVASAMEHAARRSERLQAIFGATP